MPDIEPATPGVSICIPAYRGAAHLGAAIEAILAQSYTDFELVIIDDNSPDNTDEVVARYHDPRLRYLRNASNLGPEGNWNRCLQEARGRYLKLMPQDDAMQPDCLARQVAVLEQDREQAIALVFCARTIIDGTGRPLLTRGFGKRQGGRVAASELIRACVRGGTNVIGEPGSVLMRTALARATGPFDGTIGYVIDLDYWMRLLLRGDAWYLDDALASFRVSGGSWSVAIGSGQSAAFRAFLHKLAADPRYAVSKADLWRGIAMAHLNSVLRQIFYRVVLK